LGPDFFLAVGYQTHPDRARNQQWSGRFGGSYLSSPVDLSSWFCCVELVAIRIRQPDRRHRQQSSVDHLEGLPCCALSFELEGQDYDQISGSSGSGTSIFEPG
jgi:hypothetical protein